MIALTDSQPTTTASTAHSWPTTTAMIRHYLAATTAALTAHYLPAATTALTAHSWPTTARTATELSVGGGENHERGRCYRNHRKLAEHVMVSRNDPWN
jgi:hypothetical protein